MQHNFDPLTLILIALGYFGLLVLIARITGQSDSNRNFFIGAKKSPWPVVAYGMVGASLSGVTFISIPGWVGSSQFSYFQMVLGYILGYVVIAQVLLPVYYRGGYTSIYTFLDNRFGKYSHKTGALFFILSRSIGAGFRLYLVALVLHQFIMSHYGLPYWLTAFVSIALIWVYTYKGGIKTIVWSDVLQTTMMLAAAIAAFVFMAQALWFSADQAVVAIADSTFSQIFFFEGGWSDPQNFFKQFFSGALIAIVMTGLDQDMMQKNLSCKNLKSSQKNIYLFLLILIMVNVLFLVLGATMFIYAEALSIEIPARTDLLFPSLAFNHFAPWVGLMFLLGLLASAYSSADSALTSLTTSFYLDVLKKDETGDSKSRHLIHLGFSLLLFLLVLVFGYTMELNAIQALFKAASYTYGPLLGLFAFGILSKRVVVDKWIPAVAIIAPVLTYLLESNSEWLLDGYKFGYESLLFNGSLVFLGAWLLSKPRAEIV
ncbi:MAG: sodium:solute symporter [Proteobacteria bacterium]|nr:sodium:solute symporter [Pseudomonadota bacterium]